MSGQPDPSVGLAGRESLGERGHEAHREEERAGEEHDRAVPVATSPRPAGDHHRDVAAQAEEDSSDQVGQVDGRQAGPSELGQGRTECEEGATEDERRSGGDVHPVPSSRHRSMPRQEFCHGVPRSFSRSPRSRTAREAASSGSGEGGNRVLTRSGGCRGGPCQPRSSPRASSVDAGRAGTGADLRGRNAMTDPLSSWREGATKDAILRYVDEASSEGSAGWVPAEDRVAVFDNDGTLWCEKPMPIQLDFILRRLVEMAEADPALREKQPWKAAHEHDHGWLAQVMADHYAGDDTDLPAAGGRHPRRLRRHHRRAVRGRRRGLPPRRSPPHAGPRLPRVRVRADDPAARPPEGQRLRHLHRLRRRA